MSEERQYRRVITTQEELHVLVSEALVTGVLDISHCKVEVEFNIAELLGVLNLRQERIEPTRLSLSSLRVALRVFCPFQIDASDSCFLNDVSDVQQEIIVVLVDDDKKSVGVERDKEKTSVFFEERLNFSNSVFEKNVNFSNSVFNKAVEFGGVRFKQEATFRKVSFQKAGFYNTTFEAGGSFENTDFNGAVEFGASKFSELVHFIHTTFVKKASFKQIVVSPNTDYSDDGSHLAKIPLFFKYITLHDELEIVPASLQGNINITSPNIESDKSLVVLDFENCAADSQGSVSLQGLKVYKDGIHLTILNLKKDSNVEVHFQDSGFYGKNVAFTNVGMKQVIIQGGNDVAGMAFYRCEWESDYPDVWFNLWGWLAFRGFKGLDLEANSQKIADAYAQLKVRALEAGDIQLSNDFHFWHQWHQRKRKVWNPFYLHTSAYGLTVALPLIGFSLTYGIGVLLYTGDAFQDPWLTSLSGSFPLVLNEVEPIQNAIKQVATKMGGWFYPLYILQHLIQGYLLFQIGAAIRNKVKR